MNDLNCKIKRLYISCHRHMDKLTWLVCGILLLWLFIFLYNNFLKTVNDAVILKKLNNQVAIEVVNMEKWQKINKYIEWKKQPLPKPETKINDPFK